MLSILFLPSCGLVNKMAGRDTGVSRALNMPSGAASSKSRFATGSVPPDTEKAGSSEKGIPLAAGHAASIRALQFSIPGANEVQRAPFAGSFIIP